MRKNKEVLICSLPIINNLGGETTKSQCLYEYIKKDKNIELLELSSLKNKRMTLLFRLLKILLDRNVKKIYLCKSSFTAYKLLKILTNFNKDIHYFVIGGKFDEYLKNGLFEKKYYQKVKKIYVESPKMKIELHKLGLSQSEYLPNFKKFKIREYDERKIELPLKCIFFSRITPEKGTEMICEMLEKFSEKKIYVDFYGPIEDSYKKIFFEKLDQLKNATYKGVLDTKLEKTYDKIEKYDLMLFPTYWKGEGFPGTIIDSFVAGVPIVASDWNCNKEIIKDGYNGFLFKNKNQEEFEKKIEYLLKNFDVIKKIRINCYNESKKYEIENCLRKIKI